MSSGLLAVLWESVILIAVGLYIAQIGGYHAAEQMFPRLIAYPIEALVVFSLLRRAWERRMRPTTGPGEIESVDVRALVVAVALVAAYAALWQVLGFVLDTLLLLVAGAWILGMRWKGTAAAAGIAICIIALFGYLFGTSGMATLPAGIFGIDLRW